MTKTLSTLFLFAAALFAQTPVGTIVVTPPAPGKFVATAGKVVCTVTGNAVPATGATIACTVGSVTIPAYTIPLPAGAAYTFQQTFDVDAVTVTLQSSAAGAVTWQAVATPAGGTSSGQANGAF
jgi:hypothetical protein